FNPTNAPQRFGLRSDGDSVPVAGASWWYASGQSGQDRLSMIDLPGFGTVRVPFEAAAKASPKRREATLVQSDGLLINDFLEAQIDARTGALRSLHMPGKRGNRFSLQLARREKKGASEPQYSQMQASEIQVLENSTMRGAIRAIGSCLLDGQRTADFEIDYEVLRGQRVLTVRVRLKNVVPLTGSPWSSAYVLRSAWPNESSIISTRNCAGRQTFSSGKTVAPDLIEIDDVDHRLYLLPSGLAFHQRVDARFLETILTSGTTGGGEFQLGVGVDLPNAMVSAWQYHDRAYAVPLPKTASADKSSSQVAAAAWLMNIDAKSVLMHLEAPLMHADGYCCGLRLHLTELAGKSVTARIRAIREVIEAHRVDYLGGRIAKLTVEGDTTSIALRPNEMTFVDLTWKV
ncbi:MAG: hypothetical protein IT423_06050, partial [Pirellulaceae bacterium]|nr:hypothetical protein [Pirellulaceae bacterium]